MKNTHILILLCFAVAMGAVFVSLMDNSTYADFSDAFSHTGRKYTVAGSLDKEQNIDYDPKTNANLLSFYMLDKQGVKRKVILNQAKPQDFERAESLVVTGKAGEDGTFYATEVLMKCPSKYNENKKIGE
jgi:cytochrome c-type biogenesis protein CcmE